MFLFLGLIAIEDGLPGVGFGVCFRTTTWRTRPEKAAPAAGGERPRDAAHLPAELEAFDFLEVGVGLDYQTGEAAIKGYQSWIDFLASNSLAVQ